MNLVKQKNKIGKIPIYSSFILVIANLFQLVGVLFYNWNIQEILFLYWLEVLIIALFFILKILVTKLSKSKEEKGFFKVLRGWLIKIGIRILFVIFFVIHFGGFFYLTTMILIEYFLVNINFDKLSTVLSMLNTSNLKYGALALLVSHLFSFFFNYLIKERKNKLVLEKALVQPYKRLGAFGLALCLSGIIAALLPSTDKMEFGAAVLLGIVVAKIIVDVVFHIRERLDQNKDKKKDKDEFKTTTHRQDSDQFYSFGSKGVLIHKRIVIAFIILVIAVPAFMFTTHKISKEQNEKRISTSVIISQLDDIKYALDMYYRDNKQYPVEKEVIKLNGKKYNCIGKTGFIFKDSCDIFYKIIPNSYGGIYTYISKDGSTYLITAKIEDQHDELSPGLVYVTPEGFGSKTPLPSMVSNKNSTTLITDKSLITNTSTSLMPIKANDIDL
ncbi:MAG: hypothetical protein HQ538_00905, partial [Parcubacteria group bacterium]|nr:hypothetical protein [Parcubacteria group bacterium]